MCVGGFRGHKSSNRIELSQFVQDLLHFYWFGPSMALGRSRGGEVFWGMGCPHMHAHMCVCIHAHAHTCMLKWMWINCKLLPICLSWLTCVCTCAWVCTCVWGCPVKIQYVLNKSRYFTTVWRFEIYGDSPTCAWVYGWVGGWIDGWVDGWGHVKSLNV